VGLLGKEATVAVVMLGRSKTGRTFRFILWTGLLLIEASLVARFFVVPQFHSQIYDTHPALRLEMDTVVREHPGLQVAVIAFFGLFTLANIGLVVIIWRAFKDLQANDKAS
jgi:hypothetical protein